MLFLYVQEEIDITVWHISLNYNSSVAHWITEYIYIWITSAYEAEYQEKIYMAFNFLPGT